MKIKWWAFFAALIMLFSFVGCGDKGDVLIDAEALAADISELFVASDIELVQLNAESVDIRYGIGGLYDFIYAEASITVSSDEILVVEAKDEDKAAKIFEMLGVYRDERAELFASYAPEQVSKLEDALLERAGKYVIFVASDSTDEAEKIWKEYKG